MKKNRFIFIFVILLFTIGCSSKEDILLDTKEATANAFESGPKGVNIEQKHFAYYMPDTMNQDSIQEHNVILMEGKQTYILFVNTLEPKDSQAVYESTYSDQEYELHETFKKDEQFGFVKVLEMDDSRYEIIVGIGGVKLTTVTKLNKVASSAEKMMVIANSVRYKP